jgi:hypothetical protein
MRNVINAYGVLASPLQISAAMTALRVSHVVIDSSLRARPTVVENAAKQPAWPVIMPNIKAVGRHWLDYQQQILYVCGSLAELQSTNLRIIKDWRTNLAASLKHAVVNPFAEDWKFSSNEMPIEDFVHVATKPSFLNHVQNEIYKLTPYDLQRTVRHLILGYLSGTESYTKLRQKLNSSFKLERLKALMADPQCAVLKSAVQDYRKSHNEELVAKAHGVETFEILYIVKASKK